MKNFSILASLSLVVFIFGGLYFNLNNIKVVEGCHLVNKEYNDCINVSGKFESTKKTNIKLSYPVCIKKVYVQQNAFVNKGQALFSLDKEKMIAILNKNLSQEDSQILDYKDLNSLSKQSWKSENIYNLPDIVYASEEGVISQLNIYDGCVSMANRILITINQTDDVVAKFTVNQLDYGKISVGDDVEIVPVAFSNSVYNGKISQQNAIVKQQSTAMGSKVFIDVFATIENVDNKVCDGLQVNGKILRGEPENINVLNYNFIYQDENSQYVYILKNGRACKVYIETGAEHQDYAQIVTKFPNDTIFLNGKIKNGDRVILSE